MNQLLTYAYGGFWAFIGTGIVIAILIHASVSALQIITTFIFRLINRFIRMTIVLIRGWPPNHLDADGDWKQ